jgi:hypothetical protein
MIAEEVSQFMCWANEKSKVHKGGNIGRLKLVKGFTYSQIVLDEQCGTRDILFSILEKFKATGNEWK